MSGHPRVGKSTLLARLTGQQPSIEHKSQALQVQGGTPISTSTGIAEKIIQVTVKKVGNGCCQGSPTLCCLAVQRDRNILTEHNQVTYKNICSVH